MADTAWLGKLSGAVGEGKQRLKNEAEKLKDAVNHPKSILLRPKDILTGKWDAARTLTTTMGGEKAGRAITRDDLVAFKKNIETVAAAHKLDGIKAQQVIDLSDALDRQRTSSSYKVGNKTIKPITQASPVLANGGIVRFLTNAGGSTPGVTRHHVVVDFVRLTQIAASAKGGVDDTTIRAFAKTAAKELVKSPLKFYCDCERHKYWYCYIATIGGFAVGRPYGLLQDGYPKITNPNLEGIACKHVIRVMREITASPHVQSYLARHLEKIILNHTKQGQTKQGQKDAENLAKSQAGRTDHAVQTSGQKKAERGADTLRKLAQKIPAPGKASPATLRETINKPSGFSDIHAKALADSLRAAGVPESSINNAIAAARNV